MSSLVFKLAGLIPDTLKSLQGYQRTGGLATKYSTINFTKCAIWISNALRYVERKFSAAVLTRRRHRRPPFTYRHCLVIILLSSAARNSTSPVISAGSGGSGCIVRQALHNVI